ncbi:PucR family transcriptional regulator [Catenulispora rubra]|uniref:PucR family transcriptional regulator n=1 Tax=Catenulispora rubra TaxID=280293 RepID=UPI001892177D|nr:helix-turn-helix domain-containing protein [Catenulispora rubra]
MTGTELAALAAWARSCLPGLVDAACAATVDRIPFYREGRIVDAAELRRSVEANMRFLVGAIAQPQASLDLAAPTATGRRRAQQGAPLPEVLRCYRICFTTLWDALVAHTSRDRELAAAEALLSTASLILQLTDQHALALTEAYRATTAQMMLARQERRAAMVEALLTGLPGTDTGPWEAAELLGLHRDGMLVVVAAETRALAEASLPDIERRLADIGIASGWRLTPAQQLGIVSIRGNSNSSGYGKLLTVLRTTARARTGISPTFDAVTDTPRALRLAQAALAVLPPGRSEVRPFDPSPLAALMVYQSEESRRLTTEVLGPVLALPSEDRETLLQTLAVWLDNNGSAERAGELIHCHPNTVRYRLRRVQDLTGRILSDPHGVAELAAAAYAARLADKPSKSA